MPEDLGPELASSDVEADVVGARDLSPPARIAGALREIATRLELEGERFRARSYDRAARTIELTPEVDSLLQQRRLTELPGVGPALASVIEQLARTGSIALLDRLRDRWPAVVVDLARLPKVGAVRARQIHESLAPRTLDEIADLCATGRVRRLPGFGRVSEARVLEAIRGRDEPAGVLLLQIARGIGRSLAEHLRRAPAAQKVDVCGPTRRWMEVADHLAVAVATVRPDAIRDRLRSHPLVERIAPVDDELAVAMLASGVRCDLWTVPPQRYGRAMVQATGSSAHVAAVKRLAAARGLAFEEIEAENEAGFHRALGLPFLPPEVRDGTDEIAAALAGDTFADLVAAADITGAVHCHTTYSDGKDGIEEMARAAELRRLRFLTITDHSQSASYAGGLSIERLESQWAEIAEVQSRVGVRLLRGTESDILADGSLDYPDYVLAKLDVVIASIHHRHRMDEEAMTRRLVTAMRQPLFKIWGHALGRILLHREPLGCRFDEVLDALCDAPGAIEINGDPRRLDLDPERVRIARARGIRFVLSTDAHSTRGLDHLELAVGIARRGRVRRGEVLNALGAEDFARAVRPQASSSRSAHRVRALRTAAPSASLSK
jgi:DNA polymerase (family 10)